jgi:hypothetical protein
MFEVAEGIGLGKVLQQSSRKSTIYQAWPILRDFCVSYVRSYA